MNNESVTHKSNTLSTSIITVVVICVEVLVRYWIYLREMVKDYLFVFVFESHPIGEGVMASGTQYKNPI